MNDTGCLGQMDKAVAAAIELYVTDGKKLEDGTSFVTELNNCMGRWLGMLTTSS